MSHLYSNKKLLSGG